MAPRRAIGSKCVEWDRLIEQQKAEQHEERQRLTKALEEAQQLLADAKAQHLEVKQIFREWKPLGASVVASWRITAAPLLRLRKVPLRAYAERIFAFERKIKPMLKTLKTEVRAAKAAKDAAAREMDDFDRSVRRRVARDVLGIFPGQLFLHVCGGCIFSSLVVWYCVRKREKWTPALALAPKLRERRRLYLHSCTPPR